MRQWCDVRVGSSPFPRESAQAGNSLLGWLLVRNGDSVCLVLH